MVWHFYVLTISTVSDASFRESPLQTRFIQEVLLGGGGMAGWGRRAERTCLHVSREKVVSMSDFSITLALIPFW